MDIVLRVAIALAAFCAAACSQDSTKKPARDKAPAESKQASATCEDRATRLGARLTKHAEPNPLWLPNEIEPIESTRGNVAEVVLPVIVVVQAGQVTMQGVPIALGELGRTLVEDREQAMRWAATLPPLAVYLWVDRRAPMAALRELVAHVPKEFEIRLALAGPTPPLEVWAADMRKAPEVASFIREMDENADASQKAAYLAEVIERAVGPCTPLIKTFGEVAMVDGESKGSYLAKEAPVALRACECELTHLDLFEYTMYATFGVFDRPRTWIPFPEDLGAAEVVVDLVK